MTYFLHAIPQDDFMAEKTALWGTGEFPSCSWRGKDAKAKKAFEGISGRETGSYRLIGNT